MVAALLAFAWQFFLVRSFYDGNWTALFNTARNSPPPPALQSENIYLIENESGYDGQFYHYVAHDPFLRRDFSASFDAYSYRYEKILVPALAWAFAFARDTYVDTAYRCVVLLCVGLGAFALSRYAARRGLHPMFGLLFLIVPSALVSTETMTVDVALAALVIAFAAALETESRRGLFAIMAAAPLVRETGVVLLAAYGVVALVQRRWRDLAMAACASVPWLAWLVYLRVKAGPALYGYRATPFAGTAEAVRAAIGTGGLTGFLELMVICGILLAAALAIWRLRTGDPIAIAAAGLAVLVIFQQRNDLWVNYHALGRVFTPLLLLIALSAWPRYRWLSFVPFVLVVPRHLLQPVARAIAIAFL